MVYDYSFLTKNKLVSVNFKVMPISSRGEIWFIKLCQEFELISKTYGIMM